MKTILYFLFGMAVGAFLVIFGEMADAPGVCLIGMMAAFLLFMRGVYHAKWMKKGYHIPLILLVFGAIGIVLPIILVLDNEIELFSGFMLGANAVGIAMIVLAVVKIRKNRRCTNQL